MLYCGINEVEPGMVVATPVMHPRALDKEILKPGHALTRQSIARLQEIGVTRLWVDFDAAADIEAHLEQHLSSARREVYTKIKTDFRRLSGKSVSASEIQTYRDLMTKLVSVMVAGQGYASLTDQMFAAGDTFFTHSTNVAYLSALAGIELRDYIILQRPKVSAERAVDLVALGLAGVLHDVGKLSIGSGAARSHECLGVDAALETDYRQHAEMGYKALRESRIPPTVTQAVLNHHQRYDGEGWPDLTAVSGGRVKGPQAGQAIHIFARIVSAANTLDVLLADAEQRGKPPAAALAAFAGPRFDGWFDPQVRRAILRRVPPFPVGAHVGISDGRRGVVLEPNAEAPFRPTIRVLSDRPANADDPFDDAETLRLANYPHLRIVRCAGCDVDDLEIEPAERLAA